MDVRDIVLTLPIFIGIVGCGGDEMVGIASASPVGALGGCWPQTRAEFPSPRKTIYTINITTAEGKAASLRITQELLESVKDRKEILGIEVDRMITELELMEAKCFLCGSLFEVTSEHFNGKLDICDDCRKTRKKVKRGK